MPSSVIGSILRADVGTYSQAGWECVIEGNSENLESLLGNVQPGRLGVCHQVQLKASWEVTWESKSSRLGVYNHLQSGVYFSAYLGLCKEVHLADLMNAACIVSSTHNCMHIIVF